MIMLSYERVGATLTKCRPLGDVGLLFWSKHDLALGITVTDHRSPGCHGNVMCFALSCISSSMQWLGAMCEAVIGRTHHLPTDILVLVAAVFCFCRSTYQRQQLNVNISWKEDEILQLTNLRLDKVS